MIKTKTETEQVEVVSDIICNRCGKSTLDAMKMNYEVASVRASWGYCSGKDMENHTSHLCEACYDEIIEDWTIPPTID